MIIIAWEFHEKRWPGSFSIPKEQNDSIGPEAVTQDKNTVTSGDDQVSQAEACHPGLVAFLLSYVDKRHLISSSSRC